MWSSLPGLRRLQALELLERLIVAPLLRTNRSAPTSLAGFPYREILFNADGQPVAPRDVEVLVEFTADASITDLLVLSHGWYNDIAQARLEYSTLAQCLDAAARWVDGWNSRTIALVGVLWPSMFLADPQFGPEDVAPPTGKDAVRHRIDDLKAVFSTKASRATLNIAKDLVDDLECSTTKRAQFADLLQSLVSPEASNDVYPSPKRFAADGGALLHRLAGPVAVAPTPGTPPIVEPAVASTFPQASAARLPMEPEWIRWAEQNLLSVLSFYGMKERAGEVGRLGLAPLLQLIHAGRHELRIHLVGHSFGGILVSSATVGNAGDPVIPIQSLTVCQGAFSHYSYAPVWDGTHDGVFRSMLDGHRVSGPTLVTHTVNDFLLRRMYALFSRVSETDAGDTAETQPYVAIGTDGAQKMPPGEAVQETMLAVGDPYKLQPGKVHNLLADQYIKGHNDWTIPQVAYAVLSAITATG